MAAEGKKVLITDQVFGGTSERGILAQLGVDVVEAPDTPDEATLIRLAKGAAALLVCYAKITDAILEAAAPYVVVARYGIGYDNIPVATATPPGIVVTNVPDYCLDEVADHTMALLLAMARGLPAWTEDVRNGGWRCRVRGSTASAVGASRYRRQSHR